MASIFQKPMMATASAFALIVVMTLVYIVVEFAALPLPVNLLARLGNKYK